VRGGARLARLARRTAGVLLLGLCASAPGWAAGAGPVNGFIVKLRDGAPAAEAPPSRLERVLGEARAPAAGARALGRRTHVVDFGRRLGADEAEAIARRLAQRPEVEWVVPNEREQRLAVPQDPLFAASAMSSGQWWLFPAGGSNANDIEDRRRGVSGLQSAWQTTVGSASPVVAVLDTGITAHEDLAGAVLPGRDFVSTLEYANDGDGWDADPADPGDWVSAADRSANPVLFGDCEVQDSSWHGTIIAGILAAGTDNGRGVAAINWRGRVLPVRVAGKCGAEVADIIDGMRWAAGLTVLDDAGRALPANPNPARVVNISFGSQSACNAAYQEAIDELAENGVVVVAAAGNQHGSVSRPANCRGVIGVAALNRDGFKASYSNFGEPLTIATVGGDPRVVGGWGFELGDDGLLTVSNSGLRGPASGGYARDAGTSFAAPVVAGVAGLMLGLNPALSVGQVITGLRRSARPHVVSPTLPSCSAQSPGRCICTTSTCGAGILDATTALAYAADPAGFVRPARRAETIDNADVDAALALGVADQPPNANVPPAAGADEGGGALGLGWLAALALAVASLSRRRARSRGRAPAA
jgi:serine protease